MAHETALAFIHLDNDSRVKHISKNISVSYAENLFPSRQHIRNFKHNITSELHYRLPLMTYRSNQPEMNALAGP